MTRTQDYEKFKDEFREKLLAACSAFGSVNSVSVGSGVNRQQFAKYLNGSSLPSLYTIYRIADFLGVDPAFFFPESKAVGHNGLTPNEMFEPDERSDIFVRGTGYYLEVSSSDAFNGKFVCGLSKISRAGESIKYHRKMFAQISQSNRSRLWTYKGFGNASRDGFFLFYRCYSTPSDNFGAYILHTSPMRQNNLIGVKSAFTTGGKGVPFAEPVLFHWLGDLVDLRGILVEQCGVFEFDQLPKAIALQMDYLRSMSTIEGDVLKVH